MRSTTKIARTLIEWNTHKQKRREGKGKEIERSCKFNKSNKFSSCSILSQIEEPSDTFKQVASAT